MPLSFGGIGWWIDDVAVNGDATCGTTGVENIVFEGDYDPVQSRVRIRWDMGGAGYPTVGIERAPDGQPRVRVANPVGDFGPGQWEDRDVTAGATYSYWVTAPRNGGPDLEYGPVRVAIPTGAPAPRVLTLGPVRPNPFNPGAKVPVSLDRDGRFVLRVFGVNGALVRTLHDGPGAPGLYPYAWDGRDDRGAAVPGGVYLIELKSGGRTRVEKAVLLR